VRNLTVHSRDRGCTHPGCDRLEYQCEVHHLIGYATGGHTDPDQNDDP